MCASRFDIAHAADLQSLEGYGEDGKPKLRKPANRFFLDAYITVCTDRSQNHRITLRHLLTHTSGLSYGFYR